MTVVDEFYKVGPGPSSSHTIGPMRITYDFYQRCTKLPADQLAQATGLKVHLFGSLSATGKGHGTERASLAGLVGKEPATVDPLFLDEMIGQADAVLSGEARRKDLQPLAGRHHLRCHQGRLPAPEHHDLQAHGRRQAALRAGILLGRRRVHRVEGLQAAQEGPAEISLRDDEGTAPARREEQPLHRAGHHGERGGRVRQDRGTDQRVPRQDRRRDAGDREIGSFREGGRSARSDQAAFEGGHRLGARPGRKVRKRPRHRARLRLRPGRFGGKRPRSPGHHRADGRLGRRHARDRLCPR